MAVAAFAYLKVGVVGRCRQSPLEAGFLVIGASEVGDNLLPVELPIELVHFGQFLLELFEVSLREASHDDELTELPLLLALCQFQYHVDAFLFGIADEAAGVHDGNLSLGVFGIVRHLKAVQFQLTDELLAVNKVLAATKGDEVNRASQPSFWMRTFGGSNFFTLHS